MKTRDRVIAGLALALFAGSGLKSGAEVDEPAEAALAEDWPDLSNPEVLQKILEEATLRDTLDERGPEGGKLFYAPDSQIPYTGWDKRMHDNLNVS